MNLSGFSAVYPGYMSAQNTQAETDANQARANEAAIKLLGQQVLGRAFVGAPIQTPNAGQPMAPAPGQASVPSAPPVSPPGPGGPPAAPIAAAPAQVRPAGAPPQGMPEISLQGLTQRILQTTPQVAQHPEILIAALERASPILDRQSKEDLAEITQKFREAQLKQRADIVQMQQDALDRRAKAAEEGKGARAAAVQEGQDRRAAARNERTDRRLDQADVREQRLAASAGIRQDQAWQRLALQRQGLERQIEQGNDKQALAQWRSVVDAQHKRAVEVIQANSVTSGLKPDQVKDLVADQRVAYEQAISAMRSKLGRTTPTGGTEAPVAATPAPGASSAPTAPAAPSTPPLAALKQGAVTTFANGQKWTIGPDGQPKQVQ